MFDSIIIHNTIQIVTLGKISSKYAPPRYKFIFMTMYCMYIKRYPTTFYIYVYMYKQFYFRYKTLNRGILKLLASKGNIVN